MTIGGSTNLFVEFLTQDTGDTTPYLIQEAVESMAHTVLITGANGFIGSHTTRLMESLGHKVIPVDAVPR